MRCAHPCPLVNAGNWPMATTSKSGNRRVGNCYIWQGGQTVNQGGQTKKYQTNVCSPWLETLPATLTGVARGGLRGLAPPPSKWEKNIKASLVNMTLNMRYKMTINIKFVRPGPRWGAWCSPGPDPLVGYSTSVHRPPSTQNPGYASGSCCCIR